MSTELLIKKWQARQLDYEKLADKYKHNPNHQKRYLAKAQATRDCWKELAHIYPIMNSSNHESMDQWQNRIRQEYYSQTDYDFQFIPSWNENDIETIKVFSLVNTKYIDLKEEDKYESVFGVFHKP